MICPSCGSETHSVKSVTKTVDGDRNKTETIEWCPYCPDKPVLEPLFPYGPNAGSFANSDSGKMSPAHRRDIEVRRCGPEGTMYRDLGRKYI